jgi:hypothetical protein
MAFYNGPDKTEIIIPANDFWCQKSFKHHLQRVFKVNC